MSLSIVSTLLLVACGGDSDGGSGGAAGTGGDVTLPVTCMAPGDCPSGYECVPKSDTKLMTVVDQDCLDACSQPCEMAGPNKDVCLNTCMTVCKAEVPAAGEKLEGTCMRSEGTGGGDVAGNGGAGSGGTAGSNNAAGNSSTPAFVWSGAWTADVSHTSKCEWTSNAKQMANQSYTVTINATGANTAPKATLNGGFALEGTGSNDHVNLTGDFPFRSWKGEVAKTNTLNSPNNATIKITNVESANKASGTIQGSWDASAGWTCTTESGTITLTR